MGAADALAAGELPIGVVGDGFVARARTRDTGLGRRLAHAEMLALVSADELLGFRRWASFTASDA